MGKMEIKRLPNNEGFELSGGPLVFRTEQDLRDTCYQLLRFPGMRFGTGIEGEGETKPIESMRIEDHLEPDAELKAESH